MTEKAFVKQLERIFIQDGFLAKREISTGYGVADLVVIKKEKINPQHCELRQSYGQLSKLLREDYFKVLKYLPNYESGDEPAALDYLIEKTHLSKSFLKYTILRTLEQRRYIKEEGKNFYFKINGWIPIAKEVIAIEAKMRDWKRGFIQANRYKSFADKVYLALPSETAHLVDKKLLRKHNVGLIVLDLGSRSKKITVLSRRAEPLDETKKNLAIEFFWGPRILHQLTSL